VKRNGAPKVAHHVTGQVEIVVSHQF
jgi:hypothetical protein